MHSNHSLILQKTLAFLAMVQTRSGKQTVSPQHSDGEIKGMNSPRSSRGQSQDRGDDIDPIIYSLFQKMMAKMVSEQAEASLKKATPKNKLRKKLVRKQIRITRKKVQPNSTSLSTKSVEEEESKEEQFVFSQNPPRQFVKILEEPESVNNRPKYGILAEDQMREQLREVTRAVKDIQAKSKGKQTYTGEDFYDGLDGDDNLENLPRKFIKFDGTGNPKAHLVTFYAECNRFRKDNRALFICFPRSLEGTACKHPKLSLTSLTSPSIITFQFSRINEGQNGHFLRLNLAENPKFHS